jgi:hypothetical protein
MSMLILGVAVCVAIAVAGIGDLLLWRLATDLIQARSSGGIAFSDRSAIGVFPFDHGEARAIKGTPLAEELGSGVGAALAAQHVDTRAVPASMTPLEDEPMLGAMRKTLLIASALIFAVVGLVGMQIAKGLFKPLEELQGEVDLLARGDTSVEFTSANRTDEIGHIGRSLTTIQESLVELSRLKANQRAFSLQSGVVATSLQKLWADVGNDLRHVKELLRSEVRAIGHGIFPCGHTFDAVWQSWKTLLIEGPSLRRGSATRDA